MEQELIVMLERLKKLAASGCSFDEIRPSLREFDRTLTNYESNGHDHQILNKLKVDRNQCLFTITKNPTTQEEIEQWAQSIVEKEPEGVPFEVILADLEETLNGEPGK